MSGAGRIVVVTVLLVVLGAALIKGCGDAANTDPTASVTNGAPRGLLGLRLLLAAEAVPVVVRARFDDPLPSSTAGGALLVVPPPEGSEWSRADVDEALGRVKQGDHLLVLCDDDEGVRNERLRPLLEAVGVECKRVDVPIGDELLTRATGSMPAYAPPLYVRGTGRVEPRPKAPAFVAWSSGHDGVVVKRSLGAGMVSVVGSATVLANDGIAQAGNAAFLLAEAGGRTVVVDERHHGSRRKIALIAAAARGTGPLTALFALALLVPLSLLSLAPRPGDPPRAGDDARGAPAAEAQARALAALLVRSRSRRGRRRR